MLFQLILHKPSSSFIATFPLASVCLGACLISESTCSFALFPKMKNMARGRRIQYKRPSKWKAGFNYTLPAHKDGPVQVSCAQMLQGGRAGVKSLLVNCKSTAIRNISRVSLKVCVWWRGNSHARKEFKCLSAALCNLLAWVSIYTMIYTSAPAALQMTRGDKMCHLWSHPEGVFKLHFLKNLCLLFSWSTWPLTVQHSFPEHHTNHRVTFVLMIMYSESLCDIIIHYTVMIHYFPPV